MERENQDFSKVKLANLCLKSIVENFDRHMMARGSGKVPDLNYNFLQRAYSKQLFKELAKTEYFPENLDFLLNPYLKEVDLDLCRDDTNVSRIVERMKDIGETVTALALSGYSYTHEMLLNLVLWLPNVKSLTMNNTHATDSILRNIGMCCTKLKNLSLNHSSNISDAGIEFLMFNQKHDGSVHQNHDLQHLDLIGTSVTIVGVFFALQHFPNLITFNHEKVLKALYNICADCVSANSQPLKTYKLNKLSIEYDEILLDTNILRRCTLLCPLVSKLTIDPVSSQAQIDVLSGFQHLREVHFAVINSESITLSPFIEAQGKCLEKLRVFSGSMAAETLLKSCPKLKVLDLQDVHFEPIKKIMHSILEYRLLDLQVLCFDGMDFKSDIAMKSVNLILSSCPNLETLNFVAVHLTPDFITSILQHTCIISICEINMLASDISYTDVNKLLSVAPNLKICRLMPANMAEMTALEILFPSIKFMWNYVNQ